MRDTPAEDPPTCELIADEAAILDAAASTALVLISDAFRSTMKFNTCRYDRKVVARLVAFGFLSWRVENEIAEITHTGKARVTQRRQRARNAIRMRELHSELTASPTRKEAP